MRLDILGAVVRRILWLLKLVIECYGGRASVWRSGLAQGAHVMGSPAMRPKAHAQCELSPTSLGVCVCGVALWPGQQQSRGGSRSGLLAMSLGAVLPAIQRVCMSIAIDPAPAFGLCGCGQTAHERRGARTTSTGVWASASGAWQLKPKKCVGQRWARRFGLIGVSCPLRFDVHACDRERVGQSFGHWARRGLVAQVGHSRLRVCGR